MKPSESAQNILVIGSGAREHAIIAKLTENKAIKQIYAAPGNPGISSLATCIDIGANDIEKIGDFCLDTSIDLVIVGPEAPLVAGIRDYFEADPRLSHVRMIGPGRQGAMLEGSKDFAKDFMNKYHIATATHQTFDQSQIKQALLYSDSHSLPIVIKADGLAAGKGVVIAENHAQARETIVEMLENNQFGQAGAKIVIEQFLEGVELSVFILTNGDNYVLLPEAKDYKRIFEHDKGPNTGGMGAVSPVPFATPEFMEKVKKNIIEPTLAGLKHEKIPYCGFIFFGLINVKSEPYVIEYNARMGDPETQVVMARLQTDLLDILWQTANNNLKPNQNLEISSQTAIALTLAAYGYPESYRKGDMITGHDAADLPAKVFHAGTAIGAANSLVSSGGRVLTLVATNHDSLLAMQKVQKAAGMVCFSGYQYRKDIGQDVFFNG